MTGRERGVLAAAGIVRREKGIIIGAAAAKNVLVALRSHPN